MLLKALVLCAADRGRVAAADANVCAGYGFKPGTAYFLSVGLSCPTARVATHEIGPFPQAVPESP